MNRAASGMAGVLLSTVADRDEPRLVVLALFLLTAAVAAGYATIRLTATRRTDDRTREQLAEMYRTALRTGPPTGRDGRVIVTGRTTAGPDGVVTAPLSQTTCAWYRIRVTRDDERGEGTDHHIVHEERVPDLLTVTVTADTVVLLHPDLCDRSPVPGRSRDLVERTVKEHTATPGSRRFLTPGPHLARLHDTGRLDTTALSFSSMTGSFTVTEEIIRPDVDVLVAGEATRTDTTVTVTTSSQPGNLEGVTTLSPEQIVDHIAARRRRHARLAVAFAATTVVLCPAGAILLVVGL